MPVIYMRRKVQKQKMQKNRKRKKWMILDGEGEKGHGIYASNEV